jgi:hypothetical protein
MNTKYEILTPSGFKPFHGVAKYTPQQGITLHFNDETSFNCAKYHKIKSDNEFIDAIDLLDRNITELNKTVVSISLNDVPEHYYDILEVDGHEYISSDLVSHNCEFVGSVATLIDHNFLKLMEYKKPMIIPKLPEYIKIWELPRSKAELDTRGYEYIASIDSGYGMHKDNTVMQICLVKSNITIHQVVCMAINKLDIDDFCKKAYLLLKKYHLPNLIVEQNGPGIAALKYFHNNLNYENLLHFDPRGRAMGLWASEKLKQTAVILLKTYVQRKFIKIYDKDTIHELQSFGQESVTKWGGLGGTKDDRVTALYWIIYYVQSPLFYGNIVDSVDIMKMEEDEIILGNEDDKREETDTMNRIKNIQYHMEQLENGVTYAPEEFRRLIENPEEESNAAGSVFFRS